jgi:hypothetical protein
LQGLSKFPHAAYTYELRKAGRHLMTRLLDEAVAKARRLPDAAQDEIAQVLLLLAGDEAAPIQLTPEEERDLAEALAEAERGEFASDESIRALWAKYA